MARVTGIGGVFLRSPDPTRLAAWYAEHLKLQLSDFGGATLLWSDEVPAGSGMTTWSTFPSDTSYFGVRSEPQQVMINYRVDDLDALLETLTAADVWVDSHREEGKFGRFAWIQDCDGNRLELWQPPA